MNSIVKVPFPRLVYLTLSLYEEPSEYCHTVSVSGLFRQCSCSDTLATCWPSRCDGVSTARALGHFHRLAYRMVLPVLTRVIYLLVRYTRLGKKSKGKGRPRTGYKGPEGNRNIALLFL